MGNRNYGADDVLKAHNVPVLDYSRIYADQGNLFMNQDHLNKLGGHMFTVRLLQDIRQ